MVFLAVLSLVLALAALAVAAVGLLRSPAPGGDIDALPEDVLGPVSYTHLTLPTILRV